VAEGFFFFHKNFDDFVAVFFYFGKSSWYMSAMTGTICSRKVLLDAEVEGEADGPAHQPAHDIALLFVARHDAVDGQECGGTQVVGDDAHALGVAVVVLPEIFFELSMIGHSRLILKTSGLSIAAAAAMRSRPAVVDIRLFQRHEAAVGAFVGHEDVVADFHEAAAVAVGMAVFTVSFGRAACRNHKTSRCPGRRGRRPACLLPAPLRLHQFLLPS
jgi:hypothetical protein